VPTISFLPALSLASPSSFQKDGLQETSKRSSVKYLASMFHKKNTDSNFKATTPVTQTNVASLRQTLVDNSLNSTMTSPKFGIKVFATPPKPAQVTTETETPYSKALPALPVKASRPLPALPVKASRPLPALPVKALVNSRS
jgi:hypothetical protein